MDIELSDRLVALLIGARIMNGTEALDFDLDPRGVLPKRTSNWLEAFVNVQMQFVFGHEYAHYLMGHNAILGGTASDKKIFSFDLEHEADLSALTAVARNRKNAVPALASGALALFAYLQFLEAVSCVPELKQFSGSSTHPSPHDRLWNLWQHVEKNKWPRFHIEETMKAVNDYRDMFFEFLAHNPFKARNMEPLRTYGSLYLPNYTTRMKRDRFDF